MVDQGEKVKLYSVILSPYGQRVRAVLEYFQVPYEQIEVDLFKQEQKSEQYTLINPLQQIPAISYKGNNLSESIIILQYLQEQFASGSKTLYPSHLDAFARAKLNLWVHVFADRKTGEHARLFPLLMNKDSEGLNNCVKSIQNDLKFIAKNTGLLQRQKNSPEGTKQYFWGKEVSLADFVYLPNLNYIFYLLKLATKINLFESIEETDKEYLQAFGAWYTYAVQNEHFQKSSFKIAYLPPADKSPLIAAAGWTSVEQYSFEEIIKVLFKFLNIETVQ